LINCISGSLEPSAGSIELDIDGQQHELTQMTTEDIVNLGVSLVPEGRRLFPKLTVFENLMLGAFRLAARAEIKRNLEFCYEAFPLLAERHGQLAGSMSGG
jgi:branched-chain amino acid transport system ATP-binding protein